LKRVRGRGRKKFGRLLVALDLNENREKKKKEKGIPGDYREKQKEKKRGRRRPAVLSFAFTTPGKKRRKKRIRCHLSFRLEGTKGKKGEKDASRV